MNTAAWFFLLLTTTVAQGQLSSGGLGPGLPAKTVPSNSATSTGILLYPGWDKRVTGPARQANHDMADLRAILSHYGKPEADLGLHPEAHVFPEIAYLSPLRTVELALNKRFEGSLGLSSEFLIATEGFPKGLRFRKYDRGSLKIGDNTHVYLVIDGANRVISTAFVGKGAAPLVPPEIPRFVPVEGQRYRDDVIDKSDGNALVSVSDTRKQGRFIIVYSQGKRNLTWYVPEPLINLLLSCSAL